MDDAVNAIRSCAGRDLANLQIDQEEATRKEIVENEITLTFLAVFDTPQRPIMRPVQSPRQSQ